MSQETDKHVQKREQAREYMREWKRKSYQTARARERASIPDPEYTTEERKRWQDAVAKAKQIHKREMPSYQEYMGLPPTPPGLTPKKRAMAGRKDILKALIQLVRNPQFAERVCQDTPDDTRRRQAVREEALEMSNRWQQTVADMERRHGK